MKPAEAKVLEGLRKSTLAYLSEKEYAEIVDAVEKHGLLSLTGAASRIVKGAVIKHGSHDQKTHGRGGKGSGGGGGSSGSASAPDIAGMSSVQNMVDNATNRLKDFDQSTSVGEQRYQNLSDEDKDIVESANYSIKQGQSLLRSAKTAKTPAAQKKKIQQASNKFNEAYQELSSGNQQKIVSAAGFIDTAIEKLEEMAS
jgi:hypothetical protein